MDWQGLDNYQQNMSESQPPRGFTLAAIICGIASVALCCLGPLTVPIGSLGILFAILSKRLGRPAHPLARSGLILSIIGIITGILMTVYSFYTVFTDPQFDAIREQYEQIFDYYYGTESGGLEPDTETLPDIL